MQLSDLQYNNQVHLDGMLRTNNHMLVAYRTLETIGTSYKK